MAATAVASRTTTSVNCASASTPIMCMNPRPLRRSWVAVARRAVRLAPSPSGKATDFVTTRTTCAGATGTVEVCCVDRLEASVSLLCVAATHPLMAHFLMMACILSCVCRVLRRLLWPQQYLHVLHGLRVLGLRLRVRWRRVRRQHDGIVREGGMEGRRVVRRWQQQRCVRLGWWRLLRPIEQVLHLHGL